MRSSRSRGPRSSVCESTSESRARRVDGVQVMIQPRAAKFDLRTAPHRKHLCTPEGVTQVVDVHGQVHVERVELEQHGAKRGEEGVQVEREANDVQRRPPRLVAAQVERDQGEQAAQQEGLRGRGQAFAE